MRELIIDIESLGLEAIKDKIICIGILDNENYIFFNDDENNILKDFWEYIKKDDIIITFNGNSFDIPFIVKRSIINNVSIKKLNSKDLRLLVNSFEYNYDKYIKGTLRDWASILNINVITENGEKMIDYYNNNNWEKIREHCKEDLFITKKLFERCKEVNLI